MKQSTKKIIAREFLILIGSTILFFILFFLWSWRIKKNKDKVQELTTQRRELTLYENLPYRLKVYDYMKKHTDYSLNNPTEFIENLKDSIEMEEKYNYLWSNDRIDQTFSQFHDNIINDNKSEKHLTEVLNIEEKISKKKNSFFYRKLRIFNLAFGIFSIFFLLRYVIYGVKWSVKQLKIEN